MEGMKIVETEDILFKVSEVAQLLKCNVGYVYDLINNGHLQALKLGRLKVRKVTLLNFLEEFDGYDLTDPNEVKKLQSKELQG